MENNFFVKGIQVSLGIVFIFGILFGLVYAVGFHTPDEIFSGDFLGNYSFINNVGFQGDVNLTSANVIGLDTGIPSGAVMAFNLGSCPSGWSEFVTARNRMILGSGSTYSLLQTGGTSTISQPGHTHNVFLPETGYTTNGAYGAGCGVGHISAGAGQAAGGRLGPTILSNSALSAGAWSKNIINPYVALLYCIKN